MRNYIFGKKAQRSIYGIKNHLIWTCIYEEIKREVGRRKLHEEKEKMSNFKEIDLIYALKLNCNIKS